MFLKHIAKDYGSAPKSIDKAALSALQKHNWTGNIRELRNVVERLIILGDSPVTENNVKAFATK